MTLILGLKNSERLGFSSKLLLLENRQFVLLSGGYNNPETVLYGKNNELGR